MAELQAKADRLSRDALELEAQARAVEAARVVVPLAPRRRWGGMVIVDASEANGDG